MIKKIKMPKQAGWLIPGLQVKRWFALIFVGTALMTVGKLQQKFLRNGLLLVLL